MSNNSIQNRQGKKKGFIMVPEDMADKLAFAKLNGRQHRYIWAILRKTLRYQKESDWIADVQIDDMTGIGRANVCNIKNGLVRKRILIRDGKKVGINLNYQEWEAHVSVSTHVSDSKQSSIKSDTYNESTTKHKSIKNNTHNRKRIKDSLNKGMSESEKELKQYCLGEMGMDDFSQSFDEQIPIIRDFLDLADQDGSEKFEKKWRKLKNLKHFRDIRSLETLYKLYKSTPIK